MAVRVLFVCLGNICRSPMAEGALRHLLSEKYGAKSGQAIYEHKIWKGMDHNMIRDSWGKPLRVSREVKTSGTVEIWTYRKSWLLLRNGILSEWGPNR